MGAQRGMVHLALLLALVTLPAVVLSSDVETLGVQADEAVTGLDDDSGAPAEERERDLGEAASKEGGIPLDLNSLKNAVKPRELAPKEGEEAKQKSEESVKLMVAHLKAVQTKAIEAEMKAEDKEREADEQKRLASVKWGKKKEVVLRREARLRKEAKKLRLVAEEKTKKAMSTKLSMKEQIKKLLEEDETRFAKAHFAAKEAEVARAESKTKAAMAKNPKPEPQSPCDIVYKKNVEGCHNTTKINNKKIGTEDEMDPNVIKAEEEECLRTSKDTMEQCKSASVAEMKEEDAATHTALVLDKAFEARMHAKRMAAALASFKDVEKPKKPDGPVGLFQYKGLVYRANKDGTRTWVRYPTYKCHRATAGVVPQQFPESPEAPVLNKIKSEAACEGGLYKGQGNPDFYENCECSGMTNKKGHGSFCDKWGYQFNWCYVVRECAYGNTAYSDELKDTKVLVGCRIHPPSIEP